MDSYGISIEGYFPENSGPSLCLRNFCCPKVYEPSSELGIEKMQTKRQNEILSDKAEFTNKANNESNESNESVADPVFIDGIHSFKLEGDCVLIDLFILKSTEENQFGRERAIQLKMPLTQFQYFAKSMVLKASQLTRSINQTKRVELTLVHTS